MPRYLVLLVLAAIAVGAEPSTRILSTGDLSITVALPDHEQGHYRGIRFDHGGIVTAATWRGHSFLGVLKPPRDPRRHDGAAGAPEEFHLENPPGFAEAADGGSFLKIGVGALVRPNRKPYGFMRDYVVAQWAAWRVEEAADAISCRHEAAAGAYAVRAARTIRLLPAGDGFAIERELTSTGTADLPVVHYNHSMVIIDGRPVGAGYTLTYAAPVTVAHQALVVDGPRLRFADAEIANAVYAEITGLPSSADAATVRIASGGVAVELSGDTAPSRVVVYAEKTAVCPEVFTSFTLKPGETKRWSQTFRFSADTTGR